MNEYLIDGPEKFVELVKQTELKDSDVEMLKIFCKTWRTACCSGPRNAAAKGTEATYKKIVLIKLEDIKKELLEAVKQNGFDAIRFKGSFRVNRRNRSFYDKVIVSD